MVATCQADVQVVAESHNYRILIEYYREKHGRAHLFHHFHLISHFETSSPKLLPGPKGAVLAVPDEAAGATGPDEHPAIHQSVHFHLFGAVAKETATAATVLRFIRSL